MTDTEHLADLRERFGPNATRVGDPPTAGDVAMLLRMIDQPKCVDDAKVDEIRERAKSHRAMDRMDRTMYATAVVDAMLADIDTLLAALDAANQRAADAERVEREAASDYRNSIFFEVGIVAPVIQDEARAESIARGEHREGKGNG